MSPNSGEMSYQKLRAPRDNNSALIDPPLANLSATIAANQSLLNQCDASFGAASLSAFRQIARRDLLDLIAEHSQQPPLEDDRPLIGSGHQPELFHAGVWFKNWLLARVAAQTDSRAVNLIIDNDLAGPPPLRLPTTNVANDPTAEEISLRSVAYDAAAEPLPWEERAILNSETFAQFGDTVCRQLAPLISDPLIGSIWPAVIAEAKRSNRIGLAFTAGRKQAEAAAHINNQELPLSAICDRPPFFAFVALVLNDLDRFASVYNESLATYRRVHDLRSDSHPAPDLVRRGDAIETPFWLWSSDNPTRGAMFALRTPNGLLLRNDSGVEVGPFTAEELADSKSRSSELQNAGIKIRPRALTTTLYARLALFDLFIHGIGGAKYDQATDYIIRHYFGIDPPSIATATATLHLPIPQIAGNPEHEIRKLHRQLRDLKFNPQRFVHDDLVSSNHSLRELLNERQTWIDRKPDVGQGKQRQREIARLNQELQPFLADQKHNIEQQLAVAVERRRLAAISGSREFSFCLFPEHDLPHRLAKLLED